MTSEELESYRERFNDILNCQDERIKSRRLLVLHGDLRETYNIPKVMYYGIWSEKNPELAKLFREVSEAISNSMAGRFS